MAIILKISDWIDALNRKISFFSCLFLILGITTAVIAPLARKFFGGVGANLLLELQWHFASVAFLLYAPYGLSQNTHLRIDALRHVFSLALRRRIECLGHWFFLTPLCVAMTILSWLFFGRSFDLMEHSFNNGELPLFPVKALLPASFFLLFLQGLSEIIKLAVTKNNGAKESFRKAP